VDTRGCRVALQLGESRLELSARCKRLVDGRPKTVRRTYEHDSQHDERDDRPHKQQDDGEHGHWVTGRSRAPDAQMLRPVTDHGLPEGRP
jgi:hypothetical protein